MSKKLEMELEGLLTDLVSQMRKKVNSGEELNASEVKNMIELLKNNGITCEVRQGDIPDGMLADMPSFQSDEVILKN